VNTSKAALPARDSPLRSDRSAIQTALIGGLAAAMAFGLAKAIS
jgi:hypothetical protein